VERQQLDDVINDLEPNFWLERRGSEHPKRLDYLEHLIDQFSSVRSMRRLARELDRNAAFEDVADGPDSIESYGRIGKQNKWLKLGAWSILGSLFLGGTAAGLVELSDQANQRNAERKAITTEVLRDSQIMATLGVCAFELHAQAALTKDREQNHQLPKYSPSSNDYSAAASLAQVKGIPCEPMANSWEFISGDQRIAIVPGDVVEFNLANACKDANIYISHPRQHTDDVDHGLIAGDTANRAGITC
jgi:hypothetical protein